MFVSNLTARSTLTRLVRHGFAVVAKAAPACGAPVIAGVRRLAEESRLA